MAALEGALELLHPGIVDLLGPRRRPLSGRLPRLLRPPRPPELRLGLPPRQARLTFRLVAFCWGDLPIALTIALTPQVAGPTYLGQFAAKRHLYAGIEDLATQIYLGNRSDISGKGIQWVRGYHASSPQNFTWLPLHPPWLKQIRPWQGGRPILFVVTAPGPGALGRAGEQALATTCIR